MAKRVGIPARNLKKFLAIGALALTAGIGTKVMQYADYNKQVGIAREVLRNVARKIGGLSAFSFSPHSQYYGALYETARRKNGGNALTVEEIKKLDRVAKTVGLSPVNVVETIATHRHGLDKTLSLISRQKPEWYNPQNLTYKLKIALAFQNTPGGSEIWDKIQSMTWAARHLNSGFDYAPGRPYNQTTSSNPSVR